MDFWRLGWIVAAVLALRIVAAAQGPDPATLSQLPRTVPLTSIPVPYDPMEAVTGNTQLAQTSEERAAALDLLEKAHRLSNVRLHAYDLKTSFTSYGLSSSDGRWILEDMSPGPNVYRWTAQGPSFSGTFLNADKLLSSNQPGGAMPLRLAQVRDAMWGAYSPAIGPYATLRVSNAYSNGAALHCILVAHGMYGNSQPQFSSGRSFDEAEYCVNPQTGLLETYSPYAGVYVRYDYASGLHFHEQIIPSGFTITEHGKIVIEAKTESVEDAPPKNSGLFESAGLSPLGVGQVIVMPMMVHGLQSSESLDGSAPGQVVVVHGMVSPDGHLTEVEVLASTNQSLDQAAVDHAMKAPSLHLGAGTQPGTTPQSREAVFTVQFAPRSPRPPIPPFPPHAQN